MIDSRSQTVHNTDRLWRKCGGCFFRLDHAKNAKSTSGFYPDHFPNTPSKHHAPGRCPQPPGVDVDVGPSTDTGVDILIILQDLHGG